MTRKRNNGAIVWRGESWLEPGTEIVAIITGLTTPTANDKTGDLLQLWILLAHISPVDAVRTGQDRAICGDCAHRGGWVHVLKGFKFVRKFIRTCYVLVFQSPRVIWRAFKAGKYPDITQPQRDFCQGVDVRLGAYGDPALLPFEVVESIINPSLEGHTGYTAQWENPKIDPRFKRVLMASVNSIEERDRANGQGWGAFRVRELGEPPTRGELGCPSDATRAERLTCSQCMHCSGQDEGAKPFNQSIETHGAQAKYTGVATYPDNIFDAANMGDLHHGY